MLKHLGAILLAATMALAVAGGIAGATRLEVTRSLRLTFTEIAFRGVIAEEPVEIACAMTLRADFASSTFVKRTEAVVGEMQPSNFVWTCSGGRAVLLVESGAWDVKYASFQGSLPAISGVSFAVYEFKWLFEFFPGVSCLYSFGAESPGTLRLGVSSGAVTGASWVERSVMPRRSGGIFCPPEMTVSGTARVTGASGEGATARLI